MKKIFSLLLLTIIVISSLYSAESFLAESLYFDENFVEKKEKKFGYGFSFGENTDSETSLNLNLRYSIIRLESGIKLDRNMKIGYSDLAVALNVELFRSMYNPFSFMQVNPGPWCPSVSLGFSTDYKKILGYSEISLIRIRDKDFIYEWLPVSIVFDFSKIYSWKVDIFRYTKLL